MTPSSCGKPITNDGKNEIKKMIKNSIAKNGIIAFEICCSGTPETPDATNRTSPIGGVARPIERLHTITTPK